MRKEVLRTAYLPCLMIGLCVCVCGCVGGKGVVAGETSGLPTVVWFLCLLEFYILMTTKVNTGTDL